MTRIPTPTPIAPTSAMASNGAAKLPPRSAATRASASLACRRSVSAAGWGHEGERCPLSDAFDGDRVNVDGDRRYRLVGGALGVEHRCKQLIHDVPPHVCVGLAVQRLSLGALRPRNAAMWSATATGYW